MYYMFILISHSSIPIKTSTSRASLVISQKKRASLVAVFSLVKFGINYFGAAPSSISFLDLWLNSGEVPMAEVVVSSLLLNIGATLASEATKSAPSLLLPWISAKKELMKGINEIKDELESMQSFLRIADRLKEKDENIKTFIKQTRDLAFDIEDIIDEFTYKLGEEQGGLLPKTVKSCRNIKTWRRLSRTLKEIKIKLQNIMERKERYDMKGMENEVKHLIAVGGSKSCAESAHFVEDDDIVGIDKYRDLLLRWLKDEDEQQRQPMIISVFGMGGLGKTTLVTHVYKTIKATFDVCAWVAVSQSYKTDDLLRQILKEFYREDREKRPAL